VLPRVDAEPRHETIERGKEDETLRAESDSLSFEAKSRGSKPGLMKRNPFEHGPLERTTPRINGVAS